ncbi:MAG: PqqD family peptide modification chaperone [Planctomycetota bacterium]
MENGRCYVPNQRDVAHEAFDAEVILIHFPSGHYFRLDEGGTVVWSAVARGATVGEAAQALVAAFEVEPAAAEAAASAFLADLETRGLVLAGAPPQDRPAPPAPPVKRAEFQPPTIEEFADLQELFLVDPIHEVDEAGWPHAQP